MKFIFLLVIVSLVSLGVATQYADAVTTEFNERASGELVSVHNGINYHGSNAGGVYVSFTFGTGSHNVIGALYPNDSNIGTTNGATVSRSGSADIQSNHFIIKYKAVDMAQGLTKITFPADIYIYKPNGVKNDAIPYSFVYDTINPRFQFTVDRTHFALGNDIPTLPCTDANPITTVTHNAGSTTFDSFGVKNVQYTCTDAAGNIAISNTISYVVGPADTTNPVFAAGADFSPVRLTVNDPSLPYLKVECVDQYRSYEFAYSTQTFNGARVSGDIIINTDAPGEHRISYSCTDTSGNRIDGAKLYRVYSTAVPAIPTNISIASDNDDTSLAKIGDIVTVTFDTEAGSAVSGTINGNTDTAASVSGTSGTLKLTLDGTETSGVPLTFEFTQSNSNGDAATQSAVKGGGAGTSVTPDFTNPVIIPLYAINTVFVAVDDPYTAPTLTCTDNLTPDKDATASTSSIDTASAGSHTVTYSCMDGADNAADEYVLTVNVNDTTPAVPNSIVIQSNNPDAPAFFRDFGHDVAKFGDTVTITFDTEAGSSVNGTIGGQPATGNVDGTVGTLTRTINGTETQGTSLTFSFVQTGATGDSAVAQTAVKGEKGSKSRVYLDYTKPIVTPHTINPVYLTVGGNYTYPILACTDNIDEDKDAVLDILSDTADTTSVGSTYLYHNCQDHARNNSDGYELIIHVITPATPIITSHTDNTVYLSVDDPYTIPTLTCTDDSDAVKDATASTSSIDTASAGSHTVTYSCTDSDGNAAVNYVLTVDVNDPDAVDTTPPGIPFTIFIRSHGSDGNVLPDNTKAKSGDLVILSMDAEFRSSVNGTIGGKTAVFHTLSDASASLTIKLDGTEPEGVPLTFSFIQTDVAGNSGVAYTEVRGRGIGTSVTPDFTKPVITPHTTNPDTVIAGNTYTIPTLICTDNLTPDKDATASTSSIDTASAGSRTVTYSCTDDSRNAAVNYVLTVNVVAPPAAPANISIASDNARDTTLAKSGDIVTVTFDTEEGSTVEGTIDGKNATFAFNGTSSTLTRTLNGTETSGVLTFSFVQTNNIGSAAPQTAVKGAGSGSLVTADFAAPAVPANISIASDNSLIVLGELGNTVTITFDTEAGSTVRGTIGGKDATFAFNGTSSTLTRTLDGTETDGRLIFSFVQTDAAGNAAIPQTAVRGSGSSTYVLADLTPPAIPVFTNSTATVSSSPVILAGTKEVGQSDVYLFNNGTYVDFVTATSGTFEFTGVTLTEGSNSFTVTATDASSNVSAKSGALVITLDTADPVFAASSYPTAVTLGDTVPTLSALCTDASTTTVTNDAGSITFGATGAKTILYTCTDAAGNTATQSVSYSVAASTTFNERASSTTSKTEVDGTIYHKASQVYVRFDFDGDVTGVGQPRSYSIAATNGAMNSGTSNGNSGTSSFHHTYSVDPSSDGLVTVTYPANSFTINGVSNNAVTYAFVSDRTSPTFEAGADFSTVELTVGDDSPTLPTLQCRDAYISTTSALRSGSVDVTLAGDYPVEYTCTDKAGNSVIQTKTYRVLAGAITPVITTLAANNTQAGPIPISVDFGEPVKGLTLEDFVVTGVNNSSKGAFAYGGNVAIFLIQTNQLRADTQITVSLAAGSVTDSAGTRYNAAETLVFNYTRGQGQHPQLFIPLVIEYVQLNSSFAFPTVECDTIDGYIDTTRRGTVDVNTVGWYPVIYTCEDSAGSISSATGLYNVFTPIGVTLSHDLGSANSTNAATVPITVEFDQAVTGFNVGTSDFVNVTNGATPLPTGSGTTYTLTITPASNGAVTVSIIAGAVGADDDVSKTKRTAAAEISFVSDKESPTPVISTTAPQNTTANPIPVSVDFGEPVNGLIIKDFAVTGVEDSAKTNLVYNGGNITTFDIDTASLVADTQITVLLPAGNVTDLAGNDSIASNTLVFNYTAASAPPPADTTAPAAPIFTNSTTIVSSSPVTLAGTAEADSTVTLYKGETFVATATATTGGNFEFAGVTLTEGSNSFTIAATDASSNTSAKSGALVITLDTTDPVFATSTDATAVTLGNTIPTLSALCTDANTITVTNDAGSATFDATGAKTVLYTCTDAAGNAATQSVSYSVAAADTTDPVYAGPTRIFVIHNSHGGTFNAGASGVQCTDDTDGTVNAVTTHARDFTTRTLSSQYDIRFVCTDAADNSVNFTIRYVIIAQPIVSITIEDVPSSTNDGSIEVSITFGADVTGFETRDIRVTNNAGHVLSGSGSSYTLAITPTRDGTITVTIPRGAAQAGSAINAVASFSFVFDMTAPAFATSTDATDVAFGDTIPTLSALCTDANTITVTNDAGSATFDAEGAKTVLYTCTDAAGNAATQSVSYSVAAALPSDTLAPAIPTFANSDATVSSSPVRLVGTAEADSVVTLYKGETFVDTATATGGTFEFTGVALDEGINSFTLTATDASSNVSAKSGALVITLDTEAPAIPTYISIASDNTNTSLAVSGDIVTITFDTEEGSIVKGTIGGKNATFTLVGTTGKLAITLDGTETSGVLTFSFVQTDAAGNAAATQTAVKGSAGTGTTVTATVNIDISSTATDPTFLTLIPITVTFSTPVHGFDATDLVITNGELVPSTFSGSGDTYTFNVRPILGLIPHSTNVATSTDVGVYISGSTIFSADGKNTIAQPASFSIGYVVEQLFTDSPANVVTTFSILNRNATTVREDVDNTITIYVAADVTTYALELRKGTYSNSQLVDTITYDSSVLTESFQQNNHTRYTIDSHGNIYVAEDQSSQSQINTRLINTIVYDDSSLGYLLEDVSLELGDNTFFLYDRDGVDVSRYFSITVVSIPVFSLPDSDGDGVIDTIDECLNSPSNKAVTASGCPLPEFVSTVPTYERFTMNMLYDHDAKTITASGNAHYLISGVTLLVTYDSAIFTHNQLLGGAFDSDFKTVHTNATSVSNLDGTYSFVIEDVYLPGTYLLRVSEVSADFTTGELLTSEARGFMTLIIFEVGDTLPDGVTPDTATTDGTTTTILSERLSLILDYSEIPALIESDSKSATSMNEQISIPYHNDVVQSNEVVTTLSVLNSDSYTVSRANNAPALALSYGSTVINSVRDTDNYKIEFVEAVDIKSDSDECPCTIELDFNPDLLPGSVTSVTDLKIYHFTDGRWHALDTTVSENALDTTVSDNTLSASVDSFSPFAIGVSTSALVSDPPSDGIKKKKSGGSSDDWHKKPTFGISHLTYKQIVDNGFTFNGYSLTVTDNWHTDFHLTSSLIGETNTVKIKTYAADPLKWINLYLGVPRLGDVSEAESEIHLVVSRNYTNPVDYDLDEINHYQKEGLVNENNTSASISKVKCQASDKDEKCYEFTINFTVMAPLHEEVVAISAMDEKRRQHVTYINEGVEFTGASLLDAHTAKLMQKKTNQGQAEIIELTQQDRRYNVWEDQHGYLWTLNEYGTWTQVTAADFERHQDSISSVMTRQNSNFASLIEQERQKALLVFDSGELISELDDYFAYDYSNVTSDMSKSEKYAYELQLESERAQKYSSNSD